MKPWIKRSAALVLALVMVFATGACKPDGGDETEEKKLTVYEGEVPVDLEGYEFTVVDFNSGRWNRENSGTPFYDAWQQALDEVEGLYNCKITTNYVGPGELFTALQPEVAAGGKYADLVVTTQWAYGYLMGADLMLDLNELDINWDLPYWNQNIRQISTIQGKTYAGNSSFIFDTANTYMLYYNETIWKELQLPDPTELIKSGKWTQDLFADYCRRALLDQDGSGVVDSLDDRWGITTPDGDFARAMFMGMGGHYFLTDATTGKVKLACNNDRAFSIVEKMHNMIQKDKSLCKLVGSDWPVVVKQFTDGKALFLGNCPGVNELKDMEDDWGVLPMPKLDEAQEGYASCVDHNSSVFGVTSTNVTKRETGIILNALGLHCQILEDIYWPDYKETYWRHEGDSQIIADYVVRTGQYDLAILMQNANSVFAAPMGKVFGTAFSGGSGADFSSYMQSVEEVINIQIEEVFGY